MNRKPYTFFSLLFAGSFIVASMVSMKLIMEITEKQLFTESGTATIKSPVRAWQEYEKEEQPSGNEIPDNNKYVLTNEQLESVITSMNQQTGETIHEPVEGQIGMEEAIETGKRWISTMGFAKAVYSVNATLSIGNHRGVDEVQLEPYYSFWTIHLSNQTIDIVLYINAVTGQVLNASIVQPGSMPETIPFENLNLFLQTAGLQYINQPTRVTDSESVQTYVEVKNTSLYAQMTYNVLKSNQLNILFYDYEGISNESYLIINYNFMLKDNTSMTHL